jgi:hypothetical protein
MSNEGAVHHWILQDRDGEELRSTERFDSRIAAEEWLGRRWSSLLDEGAESVVLMAGGGVVYEMSLRADTDE